MSLPSQYGYPSTLTLAGLTVIMNNLVATTGLQSNSGPDEKCLQMWSIINEVDRCQALDPPDLVLNMASNTFSDLWQSYDWYNNGV